jgi:hypothetical protein
MKKRNTKIISVILTLTILGLLLISAPAQAFLLGLSISDKDVNKGDIIDLKLTAQAIPEDSEIVSLSLNLSRTEILAGIPEEICNFKADGTIISGCNGIIIDKKDNIGYGYAYIHGYGYGYGYGENVLEYDIHLNTSEYYVGTYKTTLVVKTTDNVYNQNGEEITIKLPNPTILKACSIRAKQGAAIVQNQDFGTNNKINFYISNMRARNGQGYIMGQKGRTTYSYKFVVDKIIENDKTHAIIEVSGKYKVGIGKQMTEKSIVIFDKKNNQLDVIGKNLNIEYMDVSFKDSCI